MSRTADLRAELASLTSEYNLALGKMDAEVSRVLWDAALTASASAFEWQERADACRSRNGSKMSESEALCYEAAADTFREMSQDLVALTRTVPRFSVAALPL